MSTLNIPEKFATDAILRTLRAEGWTIKCPMFINGAPVFPAFKLA